MLEFVVRVLNLPTGHSYLGQLADYFASTMNFRAAVYRLSAFHEETAEG